MILHALVSSVGPHEYASGAWKAVEANRIALRRAGLSARFVQFPKNNPLTVLDQVTPDIRHVLLEYSKWPEIVVQLKRKHPHIGVHVRTHNAETYQYFTRALGKGRREYVNPRLWYNCLQILRRDTRCCRMADTMLGINEWDDANYWRWLPGKAPRRYLPYYSPWDDLRPEVKPQPWSLREPTIVAMPGDTDPSGRAIMENTRILSMKFARNSVQKWSFLMTWWAQWHQEVPDVGPHIEMRRDCQEPWDLLCKVRALAVLTPFGFGLKTSIIDGLAAGCHVIVHPVIAKRLPAPVQQLCLICDPSRDEDVAKLSDALSEEPKNQDLNPQLRQQAIDVLRSTFDPNPDAPSQR